MVRLKLYCMPGLLMKALCTLETIPFSSGASLLDRILENNFATERVKLIGR